MQQVAVVILAGRPHVDVQGAVDPDARLTPHQLHVRPAHVHLLGGVVGVQAGVQQQLVAAGSQQQSSVEQQPNLATYRTITHFDTRTLTNPVF